MPAQELENRLRNVEAKLDRLLDRFDRAVANGSASAPTPAEVSTWGEVFREVDLQAVALHGKEPMREAVTDALRAMSDPEALASLGRVAQILPRIEYALHAVGAGPELLDEGMELVRERTQNNDEVNRRLERARELLVSLSDAGTLGALHDAVKMVPELVRVLHALPRNPQTLEVLRALNDAVESATAEAKPMGAWSLLRALGDPAVQRAMGFGVEVARSLGSTLDVSHARKEFPV